ncbi:MAG TPA: hypothetical protein VM753_01055 [Anaeromyxobacter sp.]|jgi:hypothetical protein|nr:hypothetical protein [Anaeromyxobacter sp.]
MESKKEPKILTDRELETVAGASRMFVEPGAGGYIHKFAPLDGPSLSLGGAPYKFAPLS